MNGIIKEVYEYLDEATDDYSRDKDGFKLYNRCNLVLDELKFLIEEVGEDPTSKGGKK